MPEVTRVTRYRDEYESDDDRSTYSRKPSSGSYRTVQRYRVTPGRVEEVEDDRRSSRLELPRAERIEIDRTRFTDAPERPRSAIGIGPRSSVVERYAERDREPIRERESDRERERTRTVIYEQERRDPDSARPWERGPARPWETERDVRETDIVKYERRSTERRDEPYEIERYQKETEYYDRPDPPPAPIIIRQRAPEPQRIIVQEAPAPPPIILPPREEQVQIIRHEERREERRDERRDERPEPDPRRQEEQYYYRRDVRVDGVPRRSDEELALVNRREIRPRDSVSDRDYSDDEDIVVRRKVIRERSRSDSPHHRRHLAEGALVGAGAAALLANRGGNENTHRGRNVAGGAALGLIGAEIATRARSRYRESHDDDYYDDRRSRSRSSSRHSHRKIKTALGLAAAGLAAAAAAKYVQNRKNEQAEMGRGRSRSPRRRDSYYSDDYSDRSRSRSKSRKRGASTAVKAGVATAAITGIVEHVRNKSRQREGGRSKSRVRTGAEIAGAGLAGAAVAGLYERRKAKEEGDREISRERSVSRDRGGRRRNRTTSRSRARSAGAHSDPGVDPELGMVQYGTEPVYANAQAPGHYDPAAAAYGATRDRSGRRRQSSASSDRDDRKRNSRSRSRVRDIAGAAAGTAAAAVGINHYKKRREKKEAEQREKERRRYEETSPLPDNYYARDYDHNDRYTPSPPHASGGSGYPEPTNQYIPQQPAAAVDPLYQNNYTQHPNVTAANINEIPMQPPIPPYNPADYAGQPAAGHDPFGYPPRTDAHVSSNPNAAFPPQPTNVAGTAPEMSGGLDPNYYPPPPNLRGERVSEEGRMIPRAQSLSSIDTPPSSPTKSVMFAPLPPSTSQQSTESHKTRDLPESETDSDTPDSDRQSLRRKKKHRRHKTGDNRPSIQSSGRRRHHHHHNSSRSPSPASSDHTIVLPDRFDKHGRPIEGSRGVESGASGGDGKEMVERLAADFGEVLEGKKKWKDLLGGIIDGVQGAGEVEDSSARPGRKRRSDRDGR